MLGSLFAAKIDHPLADAREARRICNALAGRDPAAAIDEVTALLESLAGVAGFKPEQRLALIFQLDDAAIVPARRLGREYVAARLARPQEQRLWQTNRDYWSTLIAALEDSLRRHEANEKGAAAMKPVLGQLHVRLLHAGRQRLKLDQFRYGPLDPALWQLLGRAYLAAVATRQVTTDVALYGATTTAEREYLKALVFHASSMDNLLPVEIEIAEHLIAHFLPRFVFTAEVRPDNVYWVDAAKPLPPARLAKSPEPSPTLRFFNSSPALAALESLRLTISRNACLPPEVNLGGQYANEVVLNVLDHLAQCWSPKPPMRKDLRHRVKSRLTVVHGFAEIHRQLQDYGEAGEGESWVVDDISIGGMRAKAPLGVGHGGDWLHIGAVVGMRPEGADNWLVGIIRRFGRDSEAVGAVGIETLSKTPRAITADAGGLPTDAIVLDTLQQGQPARAMLQATAWEEGVSLLFSLDGARARLFPQALLESGADTVVAEYFVQESG